MTDLSADHLDRLEAFATELETQGITGNLVLADDDRPYHVLMTALADRESPRPIELAFLPLEAEDGLGDVWALQIFHALQLEVPEAARVGVLDALHELNTTLPLIGFGHSNKHGMWFYRHVALHPAGEEKVSVDLAVQAVWMVNYLLDTFVPQLESAIPR